jgi:hypothetical protein
MRRRTITTAVVVAAAFGGVSSAAQGATGSRASAFDLAVVRAKGTGPQLAPTDRVLLSATVENRGRRAAGASQLRFVMTRARRPRVSDPSLATGIAVRRVRAGGRRILRSVLAIVPPTARRGRYRIFACVAVRPPAKETQRGNNCATVAQLRVRVPRPLKVSAVLDSEHAVSTTLDAKGGSLEAPVAGGSVVRLTLPQGAVENPVTVRLVPLVRLDRFKVRGATVLAGAQIEPARLVLAEPARLEVVEPGRVPALALSFDADGRDVHLVPSVSAGGFAALLTRFGGYAVASGAKPARTAGRVPLPADPAHRIEQAMARVLLGGRQPAARLKSKAAEASQVPEDEELRVPEAEELRALLTSYYLNEIRPQLVRLAGSAAVDPDQALAALRRLTVALRQLALTGVDDGLSDADARDASELIQQIARLIFDARVAQCKHGDIRAAVILIGLLDRGRGLPIGVPPYQKLEDEVLGEDWKDRAFICLGVGIRFELNTRDEYGHLYTPVSWGERARTTTHIRGYTSEPKLTARVPDWRRVPYRYHWVGAGPIEIHSFKYEFNTACGAYWGWTTGPTYVEVEIVPFIEEIPDDSQEHLQVRFRGLGGFGLSKVIPTGSDECRAHDFARHLDCLSHLRGDSGEPDDLDRRERWYRVSLHGGTASVVDGGPFPDPPPGICFIGGQSWLIDGLFQISPEAPA